MIASVTDLPILSGTDLVDLSDVRPGLIAAQEFLVRHAYVEVGIGKQTIRAIARHLGLEDIADLPAAPCLSSWVLTGAGIEASDLRITEDMEASIQPLLGPMSTRCRLTNEGFHIEIDAEVLKAIDANLRSKIMPIATSKLRPTDRLGTFRPYQMGSAFL